MSPSEIAFQVKAENADAELFLVDCDFALVGESGVGEKTWSVPPGPYKVKARRGTAIVEKLVLVRPGAETYTVPHIPFASPSPVPGTAWTHEHHMDADLSAARDAPDVVHGRDSAIVVMMREWTEKVKSPDARPIVDPSRGLSLLTLDGELVADLERASRKDLGWEPCATCHVSVAAGAYRLRLASPDRGLVELTVIASAGWQTHVYLLTECAREPEERRADLVNASISLRRPEEWGRERHEEDWQLEELTRQALIDDRTTFSKLLKSRITRAVPPMLALYGAHVLVREAQKARDEKKEVDHRETVAAVVQRLRQTLGPAHPDVEALALGAGVANDDFRFTAPPMLRAGWLRVLAASSSKSDLVADDSFALRIADRIWGDGPWLLWTAPEQEEDFDRGEMWHARAAQVIDEFMESMPGSSALESTVLQAIRHAAPTWTDSLRDTFDKLKQKFTNPRLSAFPECHPGVHALTSRTTLDVSRARELLDNPALRKRLVREIGLPMKSIRDWVDKLQ